MLQAAGPDPIGAFLVFLHLLEREPERVAKLFLAHAEHHAPHTHPTADVTVDRVGYLLGHWADLGRCALFTCWLLPIV